MKIASFIFIVAVMAAGVGMGGYVLWRSVRTKFTTVPLTCGSITTRMPKSIMDLPKPENAESVDAFGCHATKVGCVCAKLDTRTNTGIVFGFNETDPEIFVVPESEVEQKRYLADMANTIKAGAATSTLITSKEALLHGYPSIVVTNTSQTDKGEFQGVDIFFLRGNKMFNITFQTTAAAYSQYWPDLAVSLENIVFLEK